MKLRTFTLSAAALTLASGMALAGTITGSAHDFSAAGWNSTGEICVVCHAPHNNLKGGSTPFGALLWNHTDSIATYTMYQSWAFSGADTADGQPDGPSKTCLSCHDGTVALDSFGGATGLVSMTGAALRGIDLSKDHPIGIQWPAGEEFAPTTTPITYADGSTGTVGDFVHANFIGCASCHDVHNSKAGATTPALLVMDNVGSALCLACHTK